MSYNDDNDHKTYISDVGLVKDSDLTNTINQLKEIAQQGISMQTDTEIARINMARGILSKLKIEFDVQI